jgi:RNA polymerase sigma-70 factor (ECF subfamily)
MPRTIMVRNDSSSSSSVGDMAAVGRVFQEHRPKLLAMLQRRIDPKLVVRIEAEEVLTEAFIEARRKWPTFREQSALTPYAWLYRIALDCLIEAWRRESRACRNYRQDMPLPEATSVQLALGLVSPGTNPAEAAAREELCRRVRQVMSLLKDKDREVLWMRHFDELSYREIAAVLGVEVNTAEQRYHRALGRLSDLWQQLHSDTGSAP